MEKVKAASVTEVASLLVKENEKYELTQVRRVGYLTRYTESGEIHNQIYAIYPGEYVVKKINKEAIPHAN